MEHPNAKITRDQAMEIRNKPGKHTDIAKEYGISHKTVHAIKKKIIWKD